MTEEHYRQRRLRMVEEQLVSRGIGDERVLAAMREVPRERFVPQTLLDEAYEDCALPIGHGQTISQPYTVGYMAEALRLEGPERVLEIGAGSGYGAAVLSRLAAQVDTVERIPALADAARGRLAELGYDNVQVHLADGGLGLPDQAPFDAIIVTAGARQLPEPYAGQLVEGGRLVIPIGDEGGQTMYRFTKTKGRLRSENLGLFAFVPLV